MIQTTFPPIAEIKTLIVSSEAFENNAYIPSVYTCDGENVNPPLLIRDIPAETHSLAVIVEDPDAPIRTWVHWIVWNIPPVKNIKKNSIPGIEGINDFRQEHYGGPCPPSGIHHYHFKVYALNTLLNISTKSDRLALEKAMSNHILAFGELVGLYKAM